MNIFSKSEEAPHISVWIPQEADINTDFDIQEIFWWKYVY